MSDELTVPADFQVLDTRSQALLSRVAELRIVDTYTYKLAADLSKEAKLRQEEVEGKVGAIVAAAYKVWNTLTSARKTTLQGFLDAEKLAKDKMSNYYAQAEAEGLEPPQVEGVSVCDVWEGRVIDPAKIPRKFLMPNVKALEEHTKRYKEATKIPGWEVTKSKRISQKV